MLIQRDYETYLPVNIWTNGWWNRKITRNYWSPATVCSPGAFTFSLAESLTCLKFHSWKPKHLFFKRILAINLLFFCFHLNSCLKMNDLFSVKNIFVFKKIFIAYLRAYALENQKIVRNMESWGSPKSLETSTK